MRVLLSLCRGGKSKNYFMLSFCKVKNVTTNSTITYICSRKTLKK